MHCFFRLLHWPIWIFLVFVYVNPLIKNLMVLKFITGKRKLKAYPKKKIKKIKFLCYIFPVFYFPCCIFSCCIFRVILKALHSLRHLLLLYVCQTFFQTLKRIVYIGFGKPGLIHYLVICLCLFQKYLSVSKLDFLLLSLLLLIII